MNVQRLINKLKNNKITTKQALMEKWKNEKKFYNEKEFD